MLGAARAVHGITVVHISRVFHPAPVTDALERRVSPLMDDPPPGRAGMVSLHDQGTGARGPLEG